MTRFSLILFTALALSGCSCQDRYSPFLKHTETTLRDSVAPLLEKALKRSGRNPDLISNDVGEVTDLADACELIRTHGPDAWQPGPQGGGE